MLLAISESSLAQQLAITRGRLTSALSSGGGAASAKPKFKKRKFKNPKFRRRRTKCCFIVMPFNDADIEAIYKKIVRPIVKTCKLRCKRGDEIFRSKIVMDDVRASIERADIVIADLTRHNANVFYEVGIAHTVGCPVVLIAQSDEKLPFDLRAHRILWYENTMSGGEKFKKKLKKSLVSMLKRASKAQTTLEGRIG